MDHSDNSSGNAVAYIIIVIISTFSLLLYHPAPPKVIRKNRVNSIESKSTDNVSRNYKKDAKTEKVVSDTPNLASSAMVKKVSEQMSSELSDEAYFETLLKNYMDTALIGLNNGSRTDIVIRYYKKSKDAHKVYALKDLGYYIHERPADPSFKDLESNALFYGDSVSSCDIQLIAYVLSKSGLKVQSIVPSKYHDAWKAHSVEIGSDTTALDKPEITLQEIRKNWTAEE